MVRMMFVEHGMITEFGEPFPLILEIEPGYRRGGTLKTDDGRTVFVMGISNIKHEPTATYKREEREEFTPIFGFVLNSPEEAQVFGEYFTALAEYMRKEQGEKKE